MSIENDGSELLDRDSFRESVFRRDGYKCVICGCVEPPLDSHHILERRLWTMAATTSKTAPRSAMIGRVGSAAIERLNKPS